jgi:hypothetical protein
MKLYHAAFSTNSRVCIFVAEKKIAVTLVPYLAQLKHPSDSDRKASRREMFLPRCDAQSALGICRSWISQ